MTRTRLARNVASAAAVLGTLALLLTSVPDSAYADDNDGGPAPGVARVSIIAGSVDVKRGDSGDSVAAAVNAPLSPGDYLATQDDSRAEVEFDSATDLRVAPDTQLRFTKLDAQAHALQLAAGTIEVRVFRTTDARAQIETPQATITPDESGSYFVNVDDDGNSQITVRSGRADVQTQTGTQTLAPGNTLAISGEYASPQFQTVATVAYGDFDRFVQSRDRAVAPVADNPYADGGMVGANDLYANGTWVQNAQYGQVWVPAVAPGWAPYQDGRWVWEPYYGWTWVDAEPWGWAPFHYGNWFYAAGTGWAWYPGPYAVAQPYVYRPALVAFFSFGGGFGMSAAFGNVGWVPLAPGEPFHPWWGAQRGEYASTTIVNDTTIVNNTTIVNTYRNAYAPGGVVGISNRNFANGGFTRARVLDASVLANAEPIHGVVPIVPTNRNLAFNGHVATQPFAPASRFAAFHSAPAPAGASFVRAQQTVGTIAVRNYPAHAEAITRSASAGFGGEPRTFAPQRNVDPETARPSYVAPGTSPVNEAPRGTEPAYARPAYERPATATQPAQTTGDPYARFNRGTQPANAAAPSAAAEPGTPARAPVTRTPPYRVAPAQQKKPAKHPAHPKPASDDSRGT